MSLVLPPIEAYQVQHLPIVKAYADRMGLVEVINQLVSTEMAIDPGTIVLSMILDTSVQPHKCSETVIACWSAGVWTVSCWRRSGLASKGSFF